VGERLSVSDDEAPRGGAERARGIDNSADPGQAPGGVEGPVREDDGGLWGREGLGSIQDGGGVGLRCR